MVGGAEISVAALSGLLADDQHVLDTEALAAAVQAGAITNAVTKAPTHDAVFDVKTTADAAQPAATDAAAAVSAVEAAGLTFAENKGIILDPALSADGKWSGIVEAGIAGATLAFGDLVYLAVGDSRWELTDADTDATAFGMIGICVQVAASNGSATTILLWGKVRADAVFPALTVGAPVFVGTTAGDIQVAAPSGSGDIIRIIGYGRTAEVLFFCPDNIYGKVT